MVDVEAAAERGQAGAQNPAIVISSQAGSRGSEWRQ
jgi:hypothetical protein